MKLLYGKDKFFLGIIKYFDTKKEIGHIASNNCGMTSLKYNQNFYVDSTSFTEIKAKKESAIVVFQVARQDD